MEFQCSKCGACCRTIGMKIKQWKEDPKDANNPAGRLLEIFPFKMNADGSCEKYNPNIGCTVYNERPILCQVKGMYDHYYKEQVSYEDYLYSMFWMCKIDIETLSMDLSNCLPNLKLME